ncbi:SOS response-associated peptidase [Leifsonia sp. McL0607]|uniref:SOS response-associated peptidase n=1 Tax=Leifsonia sp. McL0607 TaxID=3415672 RepID=UPI003CF9BCDA
MCGRFAMDDRVNAEISDFVETTGRRPEEWRADWEAAYNIAPTEDIPVLIDSAKDRELRFSHAHWSLVPGWSDTLKLKFPTFNARAEDITTKATWRKPVQSHRAIVLARGYYEWQGPKGHKTPYFIRYPDGQLMGFAGLYSWWPDRTKAEDDPDRWVLTATILTSDAVQTLADIHDRNPVILPEDMWLHWLDPSIVGDQALVDDAVRAGVAEASTLQFDQVAPFNSREQGSQLLEPVAS